MLIEMGLHAIIYPVEYRVDFDGVINLSSAEISSLARSEFCTLRNGVIQTDGESSFMPHRKGSNFIIALNFEVCCQK
jgi:hypothetical protein